MVKLVSDVCIYGFKLQNSAPTEKNSVEILDLLQYRLFLTPSPQCSTTVCPIFAGPLAPKICAVVCL